MFRPNIYLILLLFATYTMNCISVLANNEYSFKHYNTDNGLSQNTVYSIFQDNFGFMWFGTKDGLNRFDGTNFKLFKLSTDSNLSDNVFHRIIQDSNDNIWLSTDEGVYIYDIYQEQFHRFNRVTQENYSVNGVVTEMVADDDGDIWMSVEGKGVFCYSITNDVLKFFKIPIVEDGMKMVTLYPADNNGVWVFRYSSPLLFIDKISEEISEFNLVDDEELLYNIDEVQDVFSDQKNILLVGTSQKGLIEINTINKTHRVLLDKDAYGEHIFVRTIEKVAPNMLWIGTESGIYIYNKLTEEVVNLRHNPSLPKSLSDNAIYSIFTDKDGGVWVGSYFGGVDYYTNTYNNFDLFFPVLNEQSLQGKRVREFCGAPNGNIWIGTEDGGLNLFDPENNVFLPLPMPLRTLYNNIHSILQDGNYLWISTYTKGLNRYNLITEELVTYTYSDTSNSISQNSTFALCKDSQGLLWIGTLSGVDVYDEKTNYFTKMDELAGISIMDIFEDSNGFIWISTFLDGLYRYNPAKDVWRVFTYNSLNPESLPYNKPTSVFEDSKRRLWVTTQGGGIGLFESETESFITYNSKNGLPNDAIYQIVEDESSNLWLTSNHGLVKFIPEKKSFVNFTVDNGLKTNQFNYKSSYKDTNGRIYFGSLDGFVRFNPENLEVVYKNNNIFFTNLFINNIRVSPGNKSPLNESIITTDKIVLSHNQNSIGLQFAQLHYSIFKNYRIYYTLKGSDDYWNRAPENNHIIYSNLAPRKYELILGIAESDSNDSITEIKRLLIVVNPPFWLNGWAYLVYFILFLFGLYLVLRFYKLREQLRRQESMRNFEQEKERELYRSKINFFTNVAHEIRTPLTLIKAPLDHIILTEKIPERVDDNLQIIRKNTDRLLDLTNQLLDFRKTESESYLLNLESQNVTELIRESLTFFKPLAKQKGINFEFNLPETDMYVQIDKDAFLKILSNLLNNGIKYSDKYLKVEAYISSEDQKFHLFTENDGLLIPHEYEEEIFKPFVQFNSSNFNNGSGTGIGLALANSLVQLHNGTLSLESDSKLNIFHLVMPVGEFIHLNNGISAIEMNEINMKSNGSYNLKKSTILLVDDDIELLQFEAKFLSEYYNILVAKNGVEAIEILKDSNVNIIVSDVMMPEMDGFELTDKIKSNVEFSHIPVILLTAKVNAQSKVQGYEIGADAYLEKPFSIKVLLARIENLLQGREKLRESFMKNPLIGVSTVALTKSDEEFIKKLNNLVHDNISESNFNVENMAEHFNMSRASFYRKVKGVLDLTPNEYLRVERLKKAAQLLKEGDNKVNEVSFMVGFNSPSYFAKCFQQQFGILPKDFQEQ